LEEAGEAKQKSAIFLNKKWKEMQLSHFFAEEGGKSKGKRYRG
jgi:hypothetical protein